MTYKPINSLTLDKFRVSFFAKTFKLNEFSEYLLVIGLGILLGCTIFYICGISFKWIFIMTVAGLFPIFVLVIGSLEKALQALLIFSLSVNMDMHLGYSEKFAFIVPGIPISLTSIVLLASYAVWFIRVSIRGEKIRFFPSVTIPFCILVLWSGLSFLQAEYDNYVLSKFPGALTAFMVFFYIANFVKTKGSIHFIIKCFSITVLLSSILAICQYTFGSSFNLMFLGGAETLLSHDYSSIKISRVSALLSNANDLALFLNGLLPLLLLVAIWCRNSKLSWVCLASFLLGFITLLITYTRAGWLAFFLSFVVVLVILINSHLHKRFHSKIGLLMVIIIITISSMLLFFSKIMTRITEDDYGAAYSRLPLAEKAISTIKKNPLVGVGLGNYWPVVSYKDQDPIFGQNNRPLDVHNMYLYIGAELGLPALLLFIWISLVFFTQGLKALISKKREIYLFGLGIKAGLIGLYIHCMFENIYFGHSLFVFISFLGGCLIGLKEIDSN